MNTATQSMHPNTKGVPQLLSHLRHHNVRLWIQADRLRFRAPEGVMTPELIDQLRLHKAEIMQVLQQTATQPKDWTEPIPVLGEIDALPPAFAQERLWFVAQLQGGNSGAYNMSATLRLTGSLNRAALEASFNTVIRRHAILRTSFVAQDGVPIQQIAKTGTIALRCVDVDARAHAADCDALIRAEATAPFDLTQGPLLRALLLCVGPTEHLLTVTMHHIISDGWSIQILIRELAALYAAFIDGQPDPLPALALQYADYAHWQRNWLKGEWLARELAHWEQRLADAPPLLELPTDFPRRPVVQVRGGHIRRTLDSALTEELRNLATQNHTTLYMVLLAAFKVLLARYSGQTDIVVGTPIAGRNHPDLEASIGFFVNTLPLRTDLAGDPSFRDLLARVRTTTVDAFAHQDVPLIKLVEYLQPERSLSQNPLYQVMFAFQEGAQAIPTLAGLTIEPVVTDVVNADDDLFLQLEEGSDGLEATWEYCTDLFRAETIARMADHFSLLLRAIIANPASPILALPMLTTEEEAQLLFAWNETDFHIDTTIGFHQLFEHQVARTPDAIAVCYRDEKLTYAELNTLADQCAQILRTAGVGVDSVVALLCDRSPRFLATAIAIFKAGGAYLPLDVRAPAARQSQVLGQSQINLLLISADYANITAEACALLPADQRPQVQDLAEIYDLRFTQHATHNTQHATPQSPITNHQSPGTRLAYVIYTSGSTGLPKGAMLEQRGLVNHLYAKVRDLKLTAADIVAQTAPQSFDISVWQFFTPLVVGGRVHIIDDEIAGNPVTLLQQSAAAGITVLEVVPSLLRLIVDELAAGFAVDLRRLRWMIPTGEALPPNLARQWLHLCPAIPLVNAYGPTECSDDVTHYFITESPAADVVNMPIGRPIMNLRIYILDTHRRPVPIGVAGELYIGGIGVGRGYIHDPERTAQAFVSDPFVTDPAARLYKTGDKARYLPDGNIEYLGRLDYQVKIRGFRIELGEIEAVLEQHPAVHQAVVMDHPDPTGSKRLVAYVVPNPPSPDLRSSLRRFLEEQLPDYMVPAAFVVLETMPLTPNGKVNRKALTAPAAELWSTSDRYIAPETELQAQLVALWAEVLKIEPETIGIEHNFFALGGHSLLAVQIVARIRTRFGIDLPLRMLIEDPTVAGMAIALQEQAHLDHLLSSVVEITGETTRGSIVAPAESTREVIDL